MAKSKTNPGAVAVSDFLDKQGLLVLVNTGNEAFSDLREASGILRAIADEIDAYGATGLFQTVFDSSGNDVGRWRYRRRS